MKARGIIVYGVSVKKGIATEKTGDPGTNQAMKDHVSTKTFKFYLEYDEAFWTK